MELKKIDLEENWKTPVNEVLQSPKNNDRNYGWQKLNCQAEELTQSNQIDEDQQANCEAQKALEFKAKALFELEQIILEIEQFRQICK